MSEQRPVKFWGSIDAEQLFHEDIDEAIEEILDEYDLGQQPETITMVGYAIMPVTVDATDILERILEPIDEELGNPDGDYFKPTDRMKDAARTLAYVIEHEYVPWACEMIESREINVAEWIKAHRPDWIGADHD